MDVNSGPSAGDRSRRPISRASLGTTVGLVIAALGVVVPIAWDRYKTRSGLEVVLESSSVVVDTARGLEQLRVTYRDEAVPRVSKLDLQIANTGGTPIRNEDVVSPLRLSFKEGKVLEVRVSGVTPGDLVVTPTVLTDRSGVEFRFPLLNSGDGARVTVLLAGGIGDVSMGGRIAGVSNVRLVDKTPEMNSVWRRFTWGVWVVLGFTVLAFIIVGATLMQLGSDEQISRLWSAGALAPSCSTPSQYLRYLESFPTKRVNLEALLKWLRSSNPEAALSVEEEAFIRKQLDAGLSKYTDNFGVIGLFGVLALLGAWYVIARII